jgi:hypothetical protein
VNGHDDFELKRRLDALPREIEPPADAWPAIRARLKDGRADGQTGRRAVTTRLPLRMAALLTLLGLSASWLLVTRHNAGTWHLATAGSSRVFRVGESLATVDGRADMTVGSIGHVFVDPATRVRLLEARATGHRLALERGTIRAEISAPPRLFIVETPSGTAVDLGCAYTLSVDSSGTSQLEVTAGWVEFSEHGRIALIPAGFRAVARRRTGVGTPVKDDAPAELVAAVRMLDDYGMSSDSALEIVLRESRRADAVTLWHILSGWRGSMEQRERVYEKLAAIVPPPVPEGQARFAAIYGDPMSMRLWWEKLPGTLPIIPGWQRSLWMLYLRITG